MSENTEGLNAWKPSIKFGLMIFLLFLLACFVYGWFFEFTFWHAQADAGKNSAIAHTIYYGVFAGPVVLIVSTFASKYMRRKQ